MTPPTPHDDLVATRFREQWSLDPNVSYLNHGSFGPPPRAVLAAQMNGWRRLSANPMDFYVRQLGGHLRQARERLARLIGTSGENLVFVENASTGMNAVADSFALQPGDEVLTTDHDYGAVHRIWRRTCERAGAKFIVQPVPVPITSAEQVVTAIMAGATERTKLLVFSHVTSPTAIVFPAAEICKAARSRGLPVCIDGPHALAMRPLEIDELDCDFYATSCHKWLSAPFGSGFLYVHPRRQAELRPSVLSWGRPLHGESASWRDEFNWVGTRDPSAFLAAARRDPLSGRCWLGRIPRAHARAGPAGPRENHRPDRIGTPRARQRRLVRIDGFTAAARPARGISRGELDRDDRAAGVALDELRHRSADRLLERPPIHSRLVPSLYLSVRDRPARRGAGGVAAREAQCRSGFPA